MPRGSIIDALLERAPSIVGFTLCASLLGAWFDAPAWMPTTLAVVVGCLALALFAARGSGQGLRATHNREWVAWELAGKGMPQGFYLLAFFAFITVMLTGAQPPHALPAWAACALGIVWGIANRSYPADDEGDL